MQQHRAKHPQLASLLCECVSQTMTKLLTQLYAQVCTLPHLGYLAHSSRCICPEKCVQLFFTVWRLQSQIWGDDRQNCLHFWMFMLFFLLLLWIYVTSCWVFPAKQVILEREMYTSWDLVKLCMYFWREMVTCAGWDVSSVPERTDCRPCCEDAHPEGPPLPAPLEVWVQVCMLPPALNPKALDRKP